MHTSPAVEPPAWNPTPGDSDKRTWLLACAAAGGAAAVATAVPLLASFAPSERAKAAGGPVEVDISDIPPGGSKTVEWRGKPSGWCGAHLPCWRRSTVMTPSWSMPSPPRTSSLPMPPTLRGPSSPRSSLRWASAPTWAALPATRRLARPIPACRPTGRAASSAPAMDQPSMGRARVQEQASAQQPGSAALPIHERHAPADRRRRRLTGACPDAGQGWAEATCGRPTCRRRVPSLELGSSDLDLQK